MEFEKLSHLSCIKGSGGEKGNRPEDFVVDEITELGYVSELTKKQIQEENGEYVVFAVKKMNITTSDMIKIISQKLKINAERITVAGQKDKNAVTYQLACCWKGKDVNKEKIIELKSIETKDGRIEVLKVWNSANRINVGELVGNKFKIRLENVSDIKQINKIHESNKSMMSNYFWKQRFGINQKNIVVAKHILLKEYEEAIIEMLTDNKEDKEMIKEIGIKNFITNKKDVKEGYENIIKKQLMKSDQVGKTECLNTIKKIPASTLKMIIESYQSYLFNLELSERIKRKKLNIDQDKRCGFNKYGFVDIDSRGNEIPCLPLLGYNSKSNEIIENILWEEGIEIGDFKVRDIPEIGCKGSWRPALVNIKNLKIHEHNNDYTLEFELPKGAYATAALRELTDIERIC